MNKDTVMSVAHLAPSLEPKLRELYVKHRERAEKIDWSYHEYLPLNELRADPKALPQLSPKVYNAVEVALLTEVNLPWFTGDLYTTFRGSLSVLIDFLQTWTAEEDSHALLLETYLLISGNGDRQQRAMLRKNVIRQGWALGVDTVVGTLAYTAIQELATQVFYLRVAEAAEQEDPRLSRALRRLAKDETLHMCFYRDAVKAYLEVDPNYVYPLVEVMLKFEMPGSGIPNYLERSQLIAVDGIYSPSEYYRFVLDALWKYWDIAHLEPTLTEARKAQQRLNSYHARFGKIAARMLSKNKNIISI
jgi:acyl-[acyl-carrier-protein] desaturase